MLKLFHNNCTVSRDRLTRLIEEATGVTLNNYLSGLEVSLTTKNKQFLKKLKN
jgi:hypothetical protein